MNGGVTPDSDLAPQLTRSSSAQGDRRTLLVHVAAQAGFAELVQALADLGVDVRATDMLGRTVLQLADASDSKPLHRWARSYGKFLGRYELLGQKMHATETCLVVFARDLDENLDVALKLMANENEWLREITMRKLLKPPTKSEPDMEPETALEPEPEARLSEGVPNAVGISTLAHTWQIELDTGWTDFPEEGQRLLDEATALGKETLSMAYLHWTYELDLVHMTQLNLTTRKIRSVRQRYNRAALERLHDLDPAHIVQLLDYVELEEEAMHFCDQNRHQLQGPGKYTHLLVLPKADFDLQYALSHFTARAGMDKAEVVNIARQLMSHLQYLSTQRRIHGDVKPRNVVQIRVGMYLRWVLIDLDACCTIGERAGQKLTSSACWPPEMARQHLKRDGNASQVIAAQLAKQQTQLDKASKKYGPSARPAVRLAAEVASLEAELTFGGKQDEVLASVAFEMWYFGLLLFQLCTVGARSVWKVDQADNIEPDEMRMLAYQWARYKDEKLEAVVWPDARELIASMLEEHASDRPQSWEAVLTHPFLCEEAPLVVSMKAVTSDAEIWQVIESRVQESLPTHRISHLHEIYNSELLADYDRHKSMVAAKPANQGRSDTDIVDLAFHAMPGPPEALEKIYSAGRAAGGFDCRLGKGGDKSAYGRGSYFARHALYPCYLCPGTEPDDCNPHIGGGMVPSGDGSVTLIVAEVLLGHSFDLGTRLDASLSRPPQIDGAPHGQLYDSVQGTEGSFGIHDFKLRSHRRAKARKYGQDPAGCEEYGRQHVVYDKSAAYPRYPSIYSLQ